MYIFRICGCGGKKEDHYFELSKLYITDSDGKSEDWVPKEEESVSPPTEWSRKLIRNMGPTNDFGVLEVYEDTIPFYYKLLDVRCINV